MPPVTETQLLDAPRTAPNGTAPNGVHRGHARRSGPDSDPNLRALRDELDLKAEQLETRSVELHELRALLERALAEYSDLYDLAPVSLVNHDVQGVIRCLNEQAGRLLGLRRDHAPGLTFIRRVRAEDHAAFHQYLRRCRSGRETAEAEVVLHRPNHADVPVRLIGLRDGRDDGENCQTALLDLTERRAADAEVARLHAALERRTALAESRAEKLRRLNARLTDAEQTERRRLARHLHDHLQQDLVAAKMQAHIAGMLAADSGSDGPLAEALAKTVEQLDVAINNSRTMTVELTPPPVLHDLGLPAGLDWLADFYRNKHGLTVTVEADRNDGADRLTEDVRVLLFEATRELLLNTVKYAGVTEAAITMDTPGHERLRLRVTDRGRGFDPAALNADESQDTDPTGLGLFSLRERLDALGGTALVDSAAGQGTCVTLTVPLP